LPIPNNEFSIKPMNALNRVRNHLGGHGANRKIATACGVTEVAVGRWIRNGVLPATEITVMGGKRLTSYGVEIESLTDGAVTDAELRADNEALRVSQSAA